MKKVIIYTSATCGYCKMAKRYFDEKEIEYIEYDVSVDQEKAHEIVHKTGQVSVPVIIVEDGKEEKVILGFDRLAVEKALNE